MLGFGQNDFLNVILYSVAGIALGAGVNRLNRWLDDGIPRAYSSNKWLPVLLKLLPPALALAGVQLMSADFSLDWQTTTPGLFFVAFFFGLQTSLMEDVVRLG